MDLTPDQLEQIKAIFASVADAWHKSGGNWLLLLPWIPLALIQAYKLEWVQAVVAARWPKLSWGNLTLGGQLGLAFLLGSLPVLGGQLLLGVSLGAALALAGSAGVAALLGYHPLRLAANVARVPSVMARLPPNVAKAAGIIVPFDRKRADEERARLAAAK